MDDLSSSEAIHLLHVLPSGSHMTNKRAINPTMSLASRNMGNVSSADGVLTGRLYVPLQHQVAALGLV